MFFLYEFRFPHNRLAHLPHYSKYRYRYRYNNDRIYPNPYFRPIILNICNYTFRISRPELFAGIGGFTVGAGVGIVVIDIPAICCRDFPIILNNSPSRLHVVNGISVDSFGPRRAVAAPGEVDLSFCIAVVAHIEDLAFEGQFRVLVSADVGATARRAEGNGGNIGKRMVGIWTRPIDERIHIGGHIAGKPAVIGIECVEATPYVAGGILAHGIVRFVLVIGKGREIAVGIEPAPVSNAQ